MSETMMAKAFASALGVKATQVVYWTNLGALKCVPGTLAAGQGNKRLYAVDYLPEAAIIAQVASHRIPAKELVRWCNLISDMIAHGENPELLGAVSRKWYRGALAGKYESYIVFRKGFGVSGESFSWCDREEMIGKMNGGPSAFVINVQGTVRAVRV